MNGMLLLGMICMSHIRKYCTEWRCRTHVVLLSSRAAQICLIGASSSLSDTSWPASDVHQASQKITPIGFSTSVSATHLFHVVEMV